MAILLQGNELIATSALSAKVLARLVSMAVRRPLVINGVVLRAQDLERLAEEARQTGQPIWLGTTTAAAATQHHDAAMQHETSHSRSALDVSNLALTPASPASLQETNQNNEKRFMRTHQQRVLRHAAQSLPGLSRLADPIEVSKRLRSFLKIEEERLRIAHRMGAAGWQTACLRSFVLDTFVAHIFRAAQSEGFDEARGGGAAAAAAGCALVALGGYGRSELAPFSDLDLLFLHTGRRAGASTRELIERVLHLLWDAGLTVGQKIYKVDECLAASRTDPHFQTALASVRFVGGDEEVFRRLTDALEQKRRKNPEGLIATARHERAERYRKLGAAIYLQEPNVKESAGGLRDLHTAMWAAYARYGCRTLDELRAQGYISEDERLRTAQAHDFLLRVRHEAHWITNRKTDRLALDLQPQLAAKFGYCSSPHLQASEQFMRDYYRRARDLYLFSEALLTGAAERRDRALRAFGRVRRRQHVAESFAIKNRELHLEGDARILMENPMLFFEAVALAQTAGATFSHQLREWIRQSLTIVDRNFRQSPEAARAFLALLRQRGRVGHALRLMHEVGLLGRYLPEFGRISLLIQHDLYHHYTIDEHTLRAIDALDELHNRTAGGNGSDHNNPDGPRASLHSVFEAMEDTAPLYLSVLLHDLGKGRGSGHVARGTVLAEKVCRRLQLEEATASNVVLTVKQHILMAHVSQRRDLSEPRLIADFANQVENPDVLNMLLLLTYADMNGVGPGVWSDWKGALLLELYRRAQEVLSRSSSNDDDGGALSSRHSGASLAAMSLSDVSDIARIKQQVAKVLSAGVSSRAIEIHFAQLPERYARITNPSTVATHLQLIERLREETLACRWLLHKSGATQFTIAARDRRGLFADLAGALAAQGIEILSANLNTRNDGIVVDDFVIREAATQQAVAEHRWLRVERALHAALAGGEDVAAMVERWRTRNAPRRMKSLTTRRPSLPRVVFDNKVAEATTVIDVRATDEPGLAYKIASVLTAFGINIVFAIIATEKSDAFDVFYVKNMDGMKLSEDDMRALEAALVTSLSATPASMINSSTRYGSEVTAK